MFAGECGMEESQAMKVSACFGGGMCKAEVCGACAGALMVLGLKYGMHKSGDYARQKEADARASAFLDEFSARNGSYLCRELLGCDTSTEEGRERARSERLFAEKCPELVGSAVRILEEMFR